MSTEQWIVVNKWDEFQHYKDRRPPWIKLHTDLLDQDAFLELSPVRRSLLLGLWQLYARTHAEVRADSRQLSGQLRLRVRAEDIDSLVQAGFIRIVASKTLAKRSISASTHARPRARKEEEVEKETPLPPSGKTTSPNGRVFNCTLCSGGLTFKSKARLDDHIHVVHPEREEQAA